jgi:Flp pilus assembly protein TadG
MRCSGVRDDGGMVTAELAACLPVLVLLLAVAVSAVTVADARVRVQDAAREAARAAARGDPAAAHSLAGQAAPGVSVHITAAGEQVVAVATLRTHLLASWLPAVTVTERAVAAVEPEVPP